MSYRVYWASDYAGLEVPDNVKFYYGYEETIGEDDNEEWCFTAVFKDDPNRNVKIPFSKLELSDTTSSMFECENCLLAGIGHLIDCGILK